MFSSFISSIQLSLLYVQRRPCFNKAHKTSSAWAFLTQYQSILPVKSEFSLKEWFKQQEKALSLCDLVTKGSWVAPHCFQQRQSN